ncbi:MAG: tetratricopeptide repeat protein [Spirochaetaceae bacterium]|nr:tetratricopeptide repeat protein [Spirochaetaceae bacterium]
MQALLPIIIVVIVLAFGIIVVGAAGTKRKDSGHRGKKLKAKDRSQVLKEANRRLATNPKDPEALAAIGEIAWEEQDWERALKHYELLSEVAAGNPELDEFTANMRHGIAALRLNRFDEAYKGLAIARTIKQDSFDVNFNLGYLEFQRRQYERAVTLLKAAAGANGEHAMTLRYLGHAFFKTKAYKEALSALRRAVDIEPDDKESLFAIAECYYELGNLDQSLKIFTHLRADPALGPQAALFAGTVHLNQRLFDKAIQDFEIGLKHADVKIETSVELKYRLSAAYLKGNEIGKAVVVLNEIQSIYPNYKDVPALLGQFKELNSNRNLQTYLLGSTSEFVTLCRKIVLSYFPKAKVKVTDISVQKNDWADVLAEVETSKWSDIILFRFIRSGGVVGELSVRDFHARLKDLKAGKGYCISGGTYTDEAKKFVEARLIDLIEKPTLMNMLNTIDSRARGILAE